MDGTVAINRKRGEWRGKEKGSREERSEMTEIKRGSEGGREEGRERGRDREETSWRGDKEPRHRRVKPMQMMTLGVLLRVNEECFFFPFSEKKADEAVPGLL